MSTRINKSFLFAEAMEIYKENVVENYKIFRAI